MGMELIKAKELLDEPWKLTPKQVIDAVIAGRISPLKFPVLEENEAGDIRLRWSWDRKGEGWVDQDLSAIMRKIEDDPHKYRSLANEMKGFRPYPVFPYGDSGDDGDVDPYEKYKVLHRLRRQEELDITRNHEEVRSNIERLEYELSAGVIWQYDGQSPQYKEIIESLLLGDKTYYPMDEVKSCFSLTVADSTTETPKAPVRREWNELAKLTARNAAKEYVQNHPDCRKKEMVEYAHGLTPKKKNGDSYSLKKVEEWTLDIHPSYTPGKTGPKPKAKK